MSGSGPPVAVRLADRRFAQRAGAIRTGTGSATGDGTLTGAQALELFDAQLASRHLDLAARWLRSFGEGFYTIGSSGHEGNAAVAAAVRATDPALLHYRSGGFYCARAAQVGGVDPIRDVLRGIVASATEPIAGGRHKVFGHPKLAVDPDDLDDRLAPAARGRAGVRDRAAAGALRGDRAPATPARPPATDRRTPERLARRRDRGVLLRRRVGQPRGRPGGVQHRRLVRPHRRELPVLFVCEDNGLGISVRSPAGWVEAALRQPAGAALPARGRVRPGGHLRRRRRGGRSGCAGSGGRPCCT